MMESTSWPDEIRVLTRGTAVVFQRTDDLEIAYQSEMIAPEGSELDPDDAAVLLRVRDDSIYVSLLFYYKRASEELQLVSPKDFAVSVDSPVFRDAFHWGRHMMAVIELIAAVFAKNIVDLVDTTTIDVEGESIPLRYVRFLQNRDGFYEELGYERETNVDIDGLLQFAYESVGSRPERPIGRLEELSNEEKQAVQQGGQAFENKLDMEGDLEMSKELEPEPKYSTYYLDNAKRILVVFGAEYNSEEAKAKTLAMLREGIHP